MMSVPSLCYEDGTSLSPGDLYGVYRRWPPYMEIEMLVRTERVDLDRLLYVQDHDMTRFYVMETRTGKIWNYVHDRDVVVVDLKSL